MTFFRLAPPVILAALWYSAAPPARAQDADYDFYKTKVEPIFLKHRPTHGRCVTCHSAQGTGFPLQPLTPGSTTWTDEQSRRNYIAASRIVAPGSPTSSQLLMHPLAPEAGGDLFHSGGHQFASQDDPDWQTMAAWVRQKPKAEYTNLKILKSGDHLMEVMRTFNVSLRAECVFCHAAPDFASDAKPTKAMARRMMTMTQDIATNFGAGNVTCYTCHRGDLKPKTTQPSFPDLKYNY